MIIVFVLHPLDLLVDFVLGVTIHVFAGDKTCGRPTLLKSIIPGETPDCLG